ncbi:MAG: hypothetical protein KF723_01305 [Rhizobiaceae bacterium]|nr:hypothetical protein [Rhizobiaceae bacterium]
MSEVEAAVRAVFAHETADGTGKRANPYWSSGGHNVGTDVLIAVSAARRSLHGGRSATLTLGRSLELLETAHERYRREEDDPDGFGSATFHAIRRAFEALAAQHGADAVFVPSRL